jgi:hypothetical protein
MVVSRTQDTDTADFMRDAPVILSDLSALRESIGWDGHISVLGK